MDVELPKDYNKPIEKSSVTFELFNFARDYFCRSNQQIYCTVIVAIMIIDSTWHYLTSSTDILILEISIPYTKN